MRVALSGPKSKQLKLLGRDVLQAPLGLRCHQRMHKVREPPNCTCARILPKVLTAHSSASSLAGCRPSNSLRRHENYCQCDGKNAGC